MCKPIAKPSMPGVGVKEPRSSPSASAILPKSSQTCSYLPWHAGKSTNLIFVTNGKACPEKPRSSRGAAKITRPQRGAERQAKVAPRGKVASVCVCARARACVRACVCEEECDNQARVWDPGEEDFFQLRRWVASLTCDRSNTSRTFLAIVSQIIPSGRSLKSCPKGFSISTVYI